jgi:hypothetical protein
MKQLLTTMLLLGLVGTAISQANTALSNLASPTAVNQSLTPGTTNTRDLGTSTLAWKNIYLRGDLYMDGGRFLSNHPGGGAYNVFVGMQSAQALTTGKYNSTLGYQALYKTNSGYSNQAFGAYALYNNTSGYSNVAVGTRSLYTNTLGRMNVAIGDSALYSNNTGIANTAVGYKALFYSNNVGNVAIGSLAMQYNTSGGDNTALGFEALSYNRTGNVNVAIGSQAMKNNTSGFSNTALGYGSLINNTSGAYNVAVGILALQHTYTAQKNTAIGQYAGRNHDNGYNNVFVGANTDVNGPGYYNVVVIGQGSIGTAPSQVTIGNPASNSYRAYAYWSNISDGRYKKNIKEEVLGLAFINKLRPVTYTVDASGLDAFLNKSQASMEQTSAEAQAVKQKALKDKEAIVETGFIAQEVEQAAKELKYNFSGVEVPKSDKDVYALRYAEFVVPLVKAVQELSKKDEELAKKTEEVDDLKTRIEKLEELVIRLTNGQNVNTVTGIGSLGQNSPNPVKGSTRISYSVPEGASRAQLVLTDALGRTLKVVPISKSGTLNLDATSLSTGTYNYSLVVDGKTIETKKMMVVYDK